MINASLVRNNFDLKIKVIREIFPIEEQILIESNNGKNNLIVDFTPATDNNIPDTKDIIDISGNILEVTNHGYQTGDTVEIDNVEFTVTKITDDTFSIDGTTEGTTVKKVIISEKYFKAWTTYYIYPDATSYINVLTDVENHFSGNGFKIVRKSNPNTQTLEWHISW
jgi:hypothetical protein